MAQKGKPSTHPTIVTVLCELDVEVDALLVEDAKKKALARIEGISGQNGISIGVRSIEDVRDA